MMMTGDPQLMSVFVRTEEPNSIKLSGDHQILAYRITGEGIYMCVILIK